MAEDQQERDRQDRQARDRQDRQARDRQDGQRRPKRSGLRAKEALRVAHGQLHGLTGKQAEAVTRIEADADGGWQVVFEVLEFKRIPNSTDLLASYQLELDKDGELVGCRRVRRYLRSEQGEDVHT